MPPLVCLLMRQGRGEVELCSSLKLPVSVGWRKGKAKRSHIYSFVIMSFFLNHWEFLLAWNCSSFPQKVPPLKSRKDALNKKMSNKKVTSTVSIQDSIRQKEGGDRGSIWQKKNPHNNKWPPRCWKLWLNKWLIELNETMNRLKAEQLIAQGKSLGHHRRR